MREKPPYFFLAIFLVAIAQSIVYFSIPLLAIYLGADSLNLGGLGFISNLCYICFCLFFGKLSDKWKHKNLILLAFLCYFFFFLLFFFSKHLYQLFILMVFLGISDAMFWPSIEAWIGERRKGKSLLQQISRFGVFLRIGFIIGPIIGGHFFQISPRSPFYIACFFYFIVFFMILKEPSKTEYKTSLSSKGDTSKQNNNYTTIHSSYLYVAWIANFASYFSFGILRYIFPKLFIGIGFSSSTLGVLMSTISVSQAFTFYILGQTSRWHYRLAPLLSAQLLIAFALILIFLNNSLIIFFLSFIFIGIGMGICSFSSLFYSINTYHNRGARAGIHETFLGSGVLMGPLVGGITAQIYSLKTPYITAALINGIFIIVEIKLILKRKNLI